MSNRRVLITGAAGFLGSAICKEFNACGWQVYAGVRSTLNMPKLAYLGLQDGGSIDCIQLDILGDQSSIAAQLESIAPDIIIHCAAYGLNYAEQDSQDAINVNVLGTVNMVQAAIDAGIDKFIHVGSCGEYGSSTTDCLESQRIAPNNLYGSTKAASTLMALERSAGKIETAVIRPFAMYGPTENVNKLVPMIAHACHFETAIDLTLGEQIKDYCYVADAAKAFAAIASDDDFPAGEIFNIGSGMPIQIQELGNTIADVLGKDRSLLRWGGRPYRIDEDMRLVPDISKFQKRFGWKPTHSLLEGLGKTMQAPMFFDPI